MARRREKKPNGDVHRRRFPHSPAEKPLQHFFKIILHSTIIEKKLRIPTKFVRKFGDELSDVANFIIPNGRHWKVGLRKVQNDIWFDDGWHDFVEHHSICYGYFLVFGYRGFSNFSIFIFDVSACEIQYPFHDQGHVPGEKCQVQDQVEVEDDNSIDVFGSRIFSPSRSSLKNKACQASASKGESSKGLPPSKHNLGAKKRSRAIASGVSPYLKFNFETRSKKVKMEQLDELTNVDAAESRKQTPDKRKRSYSDEVNELQDSSRSKVKSDDNHQVPKCEEDIKLITSEMFEFTKFSTDSKRAIHAARNYNPEHPSFMVVLSPYNCYNSVLYVPKEFSERYLSEAPKYLKLEVSEGQEWPVRVRKTCRRSDFGRGLTEFFQDNNLKPGDVCVFELIKNTEVMKVSLFHAVQDDLEIITSEIFESTNLSPESKRAIHGARLYKSTNPCFMVVLSPYNCHNHELYVPSGFSKRYLRKARKLITIEISDGREWTICLKKSCRHWGFGKGWNKFCKENNLKAGDVCVFELMKRNTVLKASIFHAVQDAGPEN